MRQIATLVLAVVLVAGTIPAVGVAGAAQHDAEVQYVTNVGGDYGAHTAASTASAENESNATVTGYELDGREIAEGGTLEARLAGEGEGSTPLVMTVDGERYDLGTIEVDGERARFVVADDLPDGESLTVDIDCDGEYNAWNDWWIECEITIGSIAAGGHDVGFNGLEPTTIDVEDDASADGNVSVTDFAVADRTVGADEPLRLTVSGSGERAGEVPIALSLDGERRRLGTVSVSEAGASFVPDEGAEARDVSIRCEGGYNSQGHDGFWFRCEISFGSISVGSHLVGINDLEPARVEVDPDEAHLTGYELQDRALGPDETMRVNVSYEGESGSVPLTLSVDGERRRVGTVHVEDGRATFEAAEGEDAAVARFVPVPCPDFPYPWPDGTIVLCWPDPFPLPTAAGPHDVGVNDMGSTTVAAGDELEVTDYEFAGTVASANDTDAAVRVFRNNTHLEIRGEGVGEAPLALSLDGERRRLGTVSVTADGASFEPASSIAWPDVEVHCEGGYNSEDGWWIRCEIDVTFASISGGPHDVGVNDLEPTRVDVEPAEARMASFTVENNTIRSGDTLRVRTAFEGESGAVPVEVTVDGESRRVGTVHVEDGVVQRVETADGESALVNFVPCPDLQDDEPWIVVWCAQDVPVAAQGTHDVAINDMEPTTVTVEGGPSGGVFGGVVDFVDDVLRGLGDLLNL